MGNIRHEVLASPTACFRAVVLTVTLSGVLGNLAAVPPEGVITGRVIDAQTGSVIPCTVAIQTSSGSTIVDNPAFRGGFRSDGQFEKKAPAGETVVTISRGFDYEAAVKKVIVRAGATTKLAFELRRRTPLHRLGWYCGDSHDHMIHDEAMFPVTFDYAGLAARAEGLDYMSLAQYWNLPDATPARLEQACQRAIAGDFHMTWNMEMPKNYWKGNVATCLGHCWILAMQGYTAEGKDAIRELSQMSAWDYESDKPPTPNFESHALIHALGGIVCYTHPLRFHYGPWGGKGIYPFDEHKPLSNLAAELPYDTVTGPTYDGIDVITGDVHEAEQLWFMLLNHGYRMPGTASSDAAFANSGGAVPGKARVYTLLREPFSFSGISKAMSTGHNIATNGPLLLFEIGGHGVGDIIPVHRGLHLKAEVHAWASGRPGECLKKVEILRDGVTWKAFDLADGKAEFSQELEISEAGSSWYLARAFGSQNQIALTNPIYFEGPGYRAPQPTLAHVTATVMDARTGAPLDGIVEVITMVGRTPVARGAKNFQRGSIVLDASGLARIRVSAPGHLTVTKSIFADFPPLLNLTLNMTREQLLDWTTFDRIRNLLGQVQLTFRLPGEKQTSARDFGVHIMN